MVETEVDLCPMIFFSVSDYPKEVVGFTVLVARESGGGQRRRISQVIFLHPASLLPHIYSHGHICLDLVVTIYCLFHHPLYLRECVQRSLFRKNTKLHFGRQVEEMCLPLHSMEMTFFSSFLNSQSNSVHLMIKCRVHGSGERAKFFLFYRELCHPIKPDDCYWSIGHNYNRALVAASIGSYGAYLADGSKYRLALLLVVLILAHELEWYHFFWNHKHTKSHNVCLQAALRYLRSHPSTFIKCFHTDDGGLTGFLFPNTGLEQLCFEVSSPENEVILIIIKQNTQKKVGTNVSYLLTKHGYCLLVLASNYLKQIK
uniref:Uncharacterized protein n=1 Tax=Cucumis melo TaxID=3656 RepID=A0A9I9EEI3_CUCME